jgi:hypothetical protein
MNWKNSLSVAHSPGAKLIAGAAKLRHTRTIIFVRLRFFSHLLIVEARVLQAAGAIALLFVLPDDEDLL